MTTALREAVSPQDRYQDDARDIFEQLDHLERSALLRILGRVDDLRRDVTDRLLDIPITRDEAGNDTWRAWQLKSYQSELEDAVARWGARVAAELGQDLRDAGDLGKRQMGALTTLAGAEGVPAAVVSFGTLGLLDEQIAVAVLHSADLIKGVEASVVNTVNRAIQGVVFGGVTRSEAIQTIRAALATQPGRHDRRLGSIAAQAARIERTELISVYSIATTYALEHAAEELPGLQQEWISILDQRVDPDCAALSGKRVPVGKPFPGGWMHPPIHPNCRCKTVAFMPSWPADPFPLGTPHRVGA